MNHKHVFETIKEGGGHVFCGSPDEIQSIYKSARYYISKGYKLSVKKGNGFVTVLGGLSDKKALNKWTPYMDEMLVSLIHEGIPYHFIAECISREVGYTVTDQACASRYNKQLKGKLHG